MTILKKLHAYFFCKPPIKIGEKLSYKGLEAKSMHFSWLDGMWLIQVNDGYLTYITWEIESHYRNNTTELTAMLNGITMCTKCNIRPVFKGRGNKDMTCKNYSLHGNCKGHRLKRNDICFCGSGKKYKVCCNRL